MPCPHVPCTSPSKSLCLTLFLAAALRGGKMPVAWRCVSSRPCVSVPWATGPSDPCGEHSRVHAPWMRAVAGQGHWAGASFQGSGPPGEGGAALPARGWDLLMGSLPQGSGESTGACGLRAELESTGSFPQLRTGHSHFPPPGAWSPGGFLHQPCRQTQGPHLSSPKPAEPLPLLSLERESPVLPHVLPISRIIAASI